MGPASRLQRLSTHLVAGSSSGVGPGASLAPTRPAPAAAPQHGLFPSSEQREQFEVQGFCVADDAVRPELLVELLGASRRIRDRVHSGSLRHGYIHRNEAGSPWGIRGVVSPQHGEPSFADYLGTSELCSYIRGFTLCAEGEVGLGSVTLFTNPLDAPFSIGWHRDSSSPGGTLTYGKSDYDEATERAAWAQERWEERHTSAPKSPEICGGVQFQVALLDSDAFEIVPGSHRRWRSEQEFECLSSYRGIAKPGGLTKFSPLPGMLAVPLKAGQTMFWDGDLIHRGRMKPDVERLTLHCSMDRRQRVQAKRQTIAAPAGKSPGKSPGKASGKASGKADMRLVWRTHPDVRALLPRQWQREAWDEWAAGQTVPEEIAAWHLRSWSNGGGEQVDFAEPGVLGA